MRSKVSVELLRTLAASTGLVVHEGVSLVGTRLGHLGVDDLVHLLAVPVTNVLLMLVVTTQIVNENIGGVQMRVELRVSAVRSNVTLTSDNGRVTVVREGTKATDCKGVGTRDGAEDQGDRKGLEDVEDHEEILECLVSDEVLRYQCSLE